MDIQMLILILLIVDAVLLLGIITYLIVSGKKSKKATVQEIVNPVKEEPVKEEIQEQPVEVDAKQEIAVANEDTDVDREVAKRIPFAEKMLAIDAKTQSYYNTLNNTFRSLRKINPRISMKGVSYRLGKELVAKITIRGKTMRLHLALDVNAFAQNVYFQKDLSDVKAYAEVPLTVKVKSDRGLKNALKLVDALIQEKGIEKKTRFVEIDSLEDLK